MFTQEMALCEFFKCLPQDVERMDSDKKTQYICFLSGMTKGSNHNG